MKMTSSTRFGPKHALLNIFVDSCILKPVKGAGAGIFRNFLSKWVDQYLLWSISLYAPKVKHITNYVHQTRVR